MTNPDDIRQKAKMPAFETIDRAVSAVNKQLALESTAAVAEPDALQRLLAIYEGLRPLLVALTMLPLLRPAWRRAIAALSAALEGVAADFKAGKDL